MTTANRPTFTQADLDAAYRRGVEDAAKACEALGDEVARLLAASDCQRCRGAKIIPLPVPKITEIGVFHSEPCPDCDGTGHPTASQIRERIAAIRALAPRNAAEAVVWHDCNEAGFPVEVFAIVDGFRCDVWRSRSSPMFAWSVAMASGREIADGDGLLTLDAAKAAAVRAAGGGR